MIIWGDETGDNEKVKFKLPTDDNSHSQIVLILSWQHSQQSMQQGSLNCVDLIMSTFSAVNATRQFNSYNPWGKVYLNSQRYEYETTVKCILNIVHNTILHFVSILLILEWSSQSE